jgi:hypothetical protein
VGLVRRGGELSAQLHFLGSAVRDALELALSRSDALVKRGGFSFVCSDCVAELLERSAHRTKRNFVSNRKIENSSKKKSKTKITHVFLNALNSAPVVTERNSSESTFLTTETSKHQRHSSKAENNGKDRN